MKGFARCVIAVFGSIVFLAILVFTTGCGTVVRHSPGTPGAAANLPRTNAHPMAGQWHTVEIKPRREHDICTWQKFNPVWWLKNIDDPAPPAWYRPGEGGREFKWAMRNPFHNFTFYVIGIADKHHERSGRYPRGHRNPNGGWHFSAARHRFIWLPFVAYNRPKFDSYFGWRPRGNFGVKINFRSEPRPSLNRGRNGEAIRAPAT